jgi:hypothetical protein
VSLSLGGLGEIYQSLHAVAAGITVVLAAGNDGPVEQSLNNALPWGITVAAATMDRSFPTVVTLGDGEKLVVRTPRLLMNHCHSPLFHTTLVRCRYRCDGPTAQNITTGGQCGRPTKKILIKNKFNIKTNILFIYHILNR